MGVTTDPERFIRTLTQARACSADKTWTRASQLWQQVVALNPLNGAYWSELADARYENQEYRPAADAYTRAFELGGGMTFASAFPAALAYRVACCHARLGEPSDALAWLRTAFEHGYRDLKRAQTDPDLEALRGDARFRDLIALPGSTELSREDGWRADLALLIREVKRRAYALFGSARGHAPFRSASETEFDTAAARLREAIPRLSDVPIAVELMKLLTLLGDGHSGLRPGDAMPELTQAAPLRFYLFEEGLYVIGADPRYEALLGARVERVGSRTTSESLTALEPLISRDNDQWLREVAPHRLRQPALLHALGIVEDAAALMLTLSDATGRSFTAAVPAERACSDIWDEVPVPADWSFLPRTLPEPLPLYLENADAAYWFTYLPAEDLVYFQFNQVRDAGGETLKDFTARLFASIEEHAVERLVIDIRLNHGGNTFLELPLLHALIGSRVNQRGRLFVIIGRRTFSAAQNLTSLIQRHTHAIFVGEPTGASPNFVGETVPFELPYSGLKANVSDLYWQSSWPMDYRTWIAPDLYTPPTFAAFSCNRDPAVDAILACRQHLAGW